jgi:subtilisin family serine protease
MPIKVLDNRGIGSVADVNEGIKYAVDKGARIIILPLQLFDYVYALEKTIADAYNKGALLVAPAGNCGAGGEGCRGINPVMYPAALPCVMAVTATGQNDERMGFSEYGDYIDVAAPGRWIPGFWFYDYRLLPGTDYAAAQVAGLAALIWSVDPTLTNDEVEGIIERTAVDQVGDPAEDTPGRDDYFGYGRIDAYAAVMAALCYPQVKPDSLYFSVCNHSNPPSQTLTSPKYCTWSTGATAPWLSISPSEGYTTTVSVDISNLSYDVYTTTIIATSAMTNCVDYPQTVPITVVYTQCWRSCLPLLLRVSNRTSSVASFLKGSVEALGLVRSLTTSQSAL